MRIWWISVVIVFFSSTSWGITIDELATQFAKQPLVRADFKQARQIKGIAKPLNAKGSMIFARQQGLYWHQQQPFNLVLVLTQNKMTQIVNGEEAQVITEESNPQMFQFNNLLTAILNLDKKVLARSFSSDIKGDEKGWVLTLKPIASPINKIFNAITLSGNEFVEQVVLDDKQGDKTTINFFNQTTEPKLNQMELNYFVP